MEFFELEKSREPIKPIDRAYFKYSYDLLMNSIHDFPDSGIKADIDQGPKRILILLK